VGSRNLAFITYHWYPVTHSRKDDRKPTIQNLLSKERMDTTEKNVRDVVEKAAKYPRYDTRPLKVRLAETNSCSNRGEQGVSDVMAAALWALDHMFTVHKVGAVGVNFHTSYARTFEGPVEPPSPIPHSPPAFYNPITSARDQTGRGYVVEAKPLYYAMRMFKEARGGTLLQTTPPDGTNANLKVWAVNNSGRTHVFVINKSTDSGTVTISLSPPVLKPADVLRLKASSLDSADVTLGNQKVAADGSMKDCETDTVPSDRNGNYRIDLPVAQAIMLDVDAPKRPPSSK
jgi:hypothetical protein